MDLSRGYVDQARIDEPILIIAERQSSGRGRQGRKWVAPQSGFFATYLFASRKSEIELQSLPLAIGTVLRTKLLELGCPVGLKWPNDLLSLDGRKKISGILLELIAERELRYVLLGIGINLSGEPRDLTSTSVQTLSGREIDFTTMALHLSNALYQGFLNYERQGFAPFRNQWIEAALFKGEEISVKIGGVEQRGVFEGISDVGYLKLRQDQRILEVSSGDVI